MGHTISKVVKSENQKPLKSEGTAEAQTQTSDFEGSGDFQVTPKLHQKYNCSIAGDIPDESPLRNNCLKSLELDPRSPTVGIYRTPIVVENVKCMSFDSPVSVYSCNMRSTIDDCMTPIEPSVNVSGFQKEEQYMNEFINSLECVENSVSEKNSPLKVSKKPNSYEAKRLLHEINEKDEKHLPANSKIMIRKEIRRDITISDKEHVTVGEKAHKTRAPLSNITASSNSPITFKHSGKPRINVFAEFGLENSPTPHIQQLAQWDKNNTVII